MLEVKLPKHLAGSLGRSCTGTCRCCLLFIFRWWTATWGGHLPPFGWSNKPQSISDMSVSLWASTNPFEKTIPVTLNHFCRKLPELTQPISGSMRTLRLCGQLFPYDWYDWHLKTFADSAKALLLLLLLLLSSSAFFFFRFKLLFKGGGISCVAKRFLIFTTISFCSGFNPLAGPSIGCSRRARCGRMIAFLGWASL